ncbi:MAG: hypothetical protein JXX14_06020 [Deltaproteobacteria bacterium]|nr:hypothetical protein [Deltaproteobacteria bacterium]
MNIKSTERPPDVFLVSFALFGLIFGLYFAVEFYKTNPGCNENLQHGTVVQSDFSTVLFFRRPKLFIDTADSEEQATAILTMDSADRIPTNVTFYDCDAGREDVFLREETNPIWGTVICGICSLVLFALFGYYRFKRKHKTEFERLMDEE